MPAFHETGYGRRFFESDLPRLVKALEVIGEQLAPKTVTALAQEMADEVAVEKGDVVAMIDARGANDGTVSLVFGDVDVRLTREGAVELRAMLDSVLSGDEA